MKTYKVFLDPKKNLSCYEILHSHNLYTLTIKVNANNKKEVRDIIKSMYIYRNHKIAEIIEQ